MPQGNQLLHPLNLLIDCHNGTTYNRLFSFRNEIINYFFFVIAIVINQCLLLIRLNSRPMLALLLCALVKTQFDYMLCHACLLRDERAVGNIRTGADIVLGSVNDTATLVFNDGLWRLESFRSNR